MEASNKMTEEECREEFPNLYPLLDRVVLHARLVGISMLGALSAFIAGFTGEYPTWAAVVFVFHGVVGMYAHRRTKLSFYVTKTERTAHGN